MSKLGNEKRQMEANDAASAPTALSLAPSPPSGGLVTSPIVLSEARVARPPAEWCVDPGD